MSGEIKLEEIDTQAFTDRYGKLAHHAILPLFCLTCQIDFG